MSNAEPEATTSATKCASLTAVVYALVPAGASSAIDISTFLSNFPHGSTDMALRGRVRAALMRMANKGVVVKTRRRSGRGGGDLLIFYRDGEELSAEELTARLRPPRPPCPKKSGVPGNVNPSVIMEIGPWFVDEFGILTRTVTGVAAPVEAIAPMQAAGRSGGLASARARKANVVEAEMEAA
jgi:hypothetical protein